MVHQRSVFRRIIPCDRSARGWMRSLKEMSPQLAKNQEWRARHNGFTPTESDRTANDSALGRF
jgi:hypothetical protein